VRARGRGNVECFWRLDGKGHVDQEDVVLDVVLMVPHTRQSAVRAIGELKAYHDFQPWTADLFQDWLPYFGKALKSLFGAGVVVRETMTWENVASPAD
jgi:hypothetical protein